ncbi:MAG: SDR family oxidoreductase [Hyphomonadaceae bacterium]|nr:SDR family oxidoreductase [Hyphomonadaceae bacterium]
MVWQADLTGRRALVTGGRRGIGAAIATRLAAQGASVIIAADGENAEGVDALLDQIKSAGGQASAVFFDLAAPAHRRDAVAKAGEAFGPIDILVNNAAANNYEPPSSMGAEFRRLMFEVNVHGPVDLMQQALPHMRAQRWGRIINISSASTAQPPLPYPGAAHHTHGVAVYGASKAALDRFTIGLAAELNGSGVHVNALMPSNVCVTSANSEAARAALRAHPDWAEGVEMMAEAAFLLIAAPLSGLVMKSRDVLLMMQQPLHGLDGRSVIGDAHTIPDLS